MKNVLVSPNFKDILRPNIKIGTFPDGDSNVFIPNVDKYKNKEIFLCHRLYPNQNTVLIELLLILSILRKINAEVVLLAPYLPYSRQDKVFLKGEAASAREICQLLKKSGCKKLITFDCHFIKKKGSFVFGQLPIENISLGPELISFVKKISSDKTIEIVAPDEGATYLVGKGNNKVMKKTREKYKDGKISYRNIESMKRSFDIKGKNVLILDDMISTGSTMLKAIENLKLGGAKKVYCAAAHGFFLGDSLNKLKVSSDGVFVSNTILSPISKVGIKKIVINCINKFNG